MVVKHLLRSAVVTLLTLFVALSVATTASAQETDSTEGTSGGTVEDYVDDSAPPSGTEVVTDLVACALPSAAAMSDLTSWANDALGVNLPTCKEGVSGALDAGSLKVQNKLDEIAAGAVEKTALWIGNAGVAVLKFALGWWITGTEMDGDTFQKTVATVNDYTFYIQVAALSLSLILSAGVWRWPDRGGRSATPRKRA